MADKMSFASKFRTRTQFIERKNPGGGKWYVGLDIGYSAVKVFGPENVFCFPSYARKQTLQMESFGSPEDNFLQYKDLETGDIWIIGDTTVDDDDTEDILYARRRYMTDMYVILARTAIALTLLPAYGKLHHKDSAKKDTVSLRFSKPLFIQTGLPPDYKNEDSKILKKALSGRHHFAIAKGASAWMEFDFVLDDKDIGIIDQPFAGLVSATCTQTAKATKESKDFYAYRTLLLDVGFGTADIYDIYQKNFAAPPKTWAEFGMKAVFREITKEIEKRTGKVIAIPDLQEFLKEGIYHGYDHVEEKAVNLDFNDILEEKSKKVCMGLLDRLNKTKDLSLYHTIILDGGTAFAWRKYIAEFIHDKGYTAKIVGAGTNDNIPSIFSNARGYYFFALTSKA